MNRVFSSPLSPLPTGTTGRVSRSCRRCGPRRRRNGGRGRGRSMIRAQFIQGLVGFNLPSGSTRPATSSAMAWWTWFVRSGSGRPGPTWTRSRRIRQVRAGRRQAHEAVDQAKQSSNRLHTFADPYRFGGGKICSAIRWPRCSNRCGSSALISLGARAVGSPFVSCAVRVSCTLFTRLGPLRPSRLRCSTRVENLIRSATAEDTPETGRPQS